MLVFTSKQLAAEFLTQHPGLDSNITNTSWFPRGRYDLSHGEYSQPDYTPRRYKDGWGIHRKNYYLGGTFYAPADGRVEML